MVESAVELKDYVPFFQTIIWAFLVLTIIIIFRKQIRSIGTHINDRLASGSSLKVGGIELGELKRDVEKVELSVNQAQHGLSEARNLIEHLFLSAMSEHMFSLLKKLATGQYGPYELTGPLKWDLHYLRGTGYVDFRKLDEFPAKGPNLSDLVKINPSGKQFVVLRERLLKESNPSP